MKTHLESAQQAVALNDLYTTLEFHKERSYCFSHFISTIIFENIKPDHVFPIVHMKNGSLLRNGLS